MKSSNKVFLLGNCTRNAELKTTADGKSLCTFGIATNRTWKNPAGELQSLAEYSNILCWSALAELCGQYVKKGMPVYVEGYLKTRSWVHPEHAEVTLFKTEVVADNVIFVGPRPEAQHVEENEPTDTVF